MCAFFGSSIEDLAVFLEEGGDAAAEGLVVGVGKGGGGWGGGGGVRGRVGLDGLTGGGLGFLEEGEVAL